MNTQTTTASAMMISTAVLLAGCASGRHPTSAPAPVPQATSQVPPTGAASIQNPPGLPADWAAQAIQTAATGVRSCAQANSLQPTNCPQQANGFGNTVSVHWTLLNQPMGGATAVPTDPIGAVGIDDYAGQVAVYGHYEMSVSYTTTGQSIRPHLSYSGGIALATMKWDGRSFQNLMIKSGPATFLPSGVTVAPFTRPSEVSDAAVLHAVQSGFHDCVTITVTNSATTPPNCSNGGPPLDPNFINLHWALNGDPMQGALVSFDTDHGNFAVTGSASMTLSAVRSVPGQPGDPQTFKTSGNYTATLVWDGHQLTLLNIA